MLIFKVDFEKVYDLVSLGFLDYILGKFGFYEWQSQIQACVLLEILRSWLIGSHPHQVNIKKKDSSREILKLHSFFFFFKKTQAPFLFLLLVEFEILCGKLMPCCFPFFTVRVIPFFLGKASVENMWMMKTIIRCFELIYSLGVNFA